MKFLVTYRERRVEGGSSAAPRTSQPLSGHALPPGLTVHAHVARIGGNGGSLVVETGEAGTLEALARLFSAYALRIEPVLDLGAPVTPAPAPGHHDALPEMPLSEPHEGAFSDDDVYDTED